ncbi:acyl-coenzyme a oxidase [Stylonychia lemnae]|uniref:Acyl-coenzyme A oxidase n=1 Tax=Stylonychia lemnae TaxID=5949 RepID=A0A078A3T6_STYLE|nr:acyl-coenzyme a oxidase [Stylonychia lemnae]|eukprot:CDW76918.1 acyl-coenzyme a oxidase [Stylonychia lemnae]
MDKKVSKNKTVLTNKSFPQFSEAHGSVSARRVNPDLLEERQKCDFDQQELTKIFYGSSYMNHKKYQKIINDNPTLHGNPDYYDMDRNQQMIHAMKVVEASGKTEIIEVEKDYYFKSELSIAEYLQGQVPFAISFSMFNLVVTNLSLPDQRVYWRELLTNRRIMGCYAQTELGHGSNVAALETTATFDKETDQFIINSPTLTSAKFWPGELGKFANYTALCARLIIDGNDYGVQFFIVQIRDKETHETLPGIDAGDIGPKIGYNSKDNGFIIFKNVRIPRTNMMMKYCRVDREGKMELDGDPRLLYSVMLGIRVWIMISAWMYLGQSVLIAGRYSVVRRQFNTLDSDKKIERKLLDYQSHQFKIIPAIAQVVVQNLARNHINNIYQAYILDLEKGSDNFKPLKVIHHLVSGLKANYTQNSYETMSKLRESCGGAGYLSSSGLPSLIQEYAAQVTYEGDNTVMLQQSARYIIDGVSKNKKYKEDALTYLNDLPQQFLNLPVINKHQDLSKLESVLDALRVRSAFFIHKTINDGMKIQKSKMSKAKLINEVFQQDQIILSNYHLAYYSVWSSCHFLEKNKDSMKCTNLKSHLIDLIHIYGLMELTKDSSILYSCGYFKAGHATLIQETLKQLINKLRPQTISIIESFDISDQQITSSIGNQYGDIAETILDQARNSKLNQNELAPGFKEHILPILQGKL